MKKEVHKSKSSLMKRLRNYRRTLTNPRTSLDHQLISQKRRMSLKEIKLIMLMITPLVQ